MAERALLVYLFLICVMCLLVLGAWVLGAPGVGL